MLNSTLQYTTPLHFQADGTPSQGVPMPANMFLYNPFSNFKQGTMSSASSSRFSTSKIGKHQLNNTVASIRGDLSNRRALSP